jgi:methionyl aminopeptidase
VSATPADANARDGEPWPAGARHTRLMPDGWTVVTKDKSLSAQWEHMIAVTDDGAEILTRLPGDDNDL